MKAAISLLVFFTSVMSYSQSNLHNKLEFTKEGLSNTDQTISLDGLSAKEIYSRINKYIQKNYYNPEKVTKGNIENEFVSFSGIKKVSVDNYVSSDIEYYINIDIKDGKMKFKFVKLNQITHIDNQDDVVADLLNTSGYFKKDGSMNPKFKKNRLDTETAINSIIDSLVASVVDTKSEW